MKQMLRNYKAYAFTFKVLLILLMINGSDQGSENSSSSASSDSSADISDVDVTSECGYSEFAEYTLTEEASLMKYAKKIEAKIANSPSRFTDSSEVCLPEDPNAKPSDEPQMHCYRLGDGGKWMKRNLTYGIKNYSKKLTRSQVDDAIGRAFKAWADVTPLTFKKGDGRVDISITFRFMQGRVLGITAFPRAGGSVVLTDNIDWTVDSPEGKNLRRVATHEIGHALGLDHSHVHRAVMFPKYHADSEVNFKLHPDDVAGIQALYGKPNSGRPSSESTKSRSINNKDQAPARDFHQPGAPGLAGGGGVAGIGGLAGRGGFGGRGGLAGGGGLPGGGQRSWRSTPRGPVYWPPAQRGGRDTMYMWNRGGVRPHYYSGGAGGWFPYNR